jgi:hypothetical protein
MVTPFGLFTEGRVIADLLKEETISAEEDLMYPKVLRTAV